MYQHHLKDKDDAYGNHWLDFSWMPLVGEIYVTDKDTGYSWVCPKCDAHLLGIYPDSVAPDEHLQQQHGMSEDEADFVLWGLGEITPGDGKND